jgi:hypothetical protein
MPQLHLGAFGEKSHHFKECSMIREDNRWEGVIRIRLSDA